MAHANIGTLLDQYNISTLDEFGRRDPRDRDAFLKHIRSSAEYRAQEELKELHALLETVEHEPGLKMCFRVSRDSSGNWVNIPNETFARKIAFLTSRTVIVFPFSEMSPRRGEDVEALLNLLCRTRAFLKENYISIIPDLPKSDVLNRTLQRLMPANFQLSRLQSQFEEKEHPTFIRNLYHPLLNNISDQEIISIRNAESQLYARLEFRLEKDLMENGFNEKDLLKELQEIHSYIVKIDQLLKETSDAIRQGLPYRLLFLILSACAFLPIAPPVIATAASSLVAIAGTYQLKDIIKAMFDERKKLKDQKNDDFFLTWKLNHPGDIGSLKGLLKYVLSASEKKELSIK